MDRIQLYDENDGLIEQDGKPAFVIMTYERYTALLEELEELEDAVEAMELMERVRSGEEEVRSWDQFVSELDATVQN